MVGKCANNLCCVARRSSIDGKTFRLDIHLGNNLGNRQRKTAYIWLCERCAMEMHPDVKVVADKVTLCLLANRHECAPRPITVH